MKSRSFQADEQGAALLEYTVLFGLLAAALIGSVVGVGSWIQSEWSGQQNLYATYYSGGSGSGGTGTGTGGSGAGTGSGTGSTGSGTGTGSTGNGNGNAGGNGNGNAGGNGNGNGGKK